MGKSPLKALRKMTELHYYKAHAVPKRISYHKQRFSLVFLRLQRGNSDSMAGFISDWASGKQMHRESTAGERAPQFTARPSVGMVKFVGPACSGRCPDTPQRSVTSSLPKRLFLRLTTTNRRSGKLYVGGTKNLWATKPNYPSEAEWIKPYTASVHCKADRRVAAVFPSGQLPSPWLCFSPPARTLKPTRRRAWLRNSKQAL